MENILFMVGSLIIILLGAEAFTNSIEWFGKKLSLNEGAVGSVLAAVGTALPETVIPLIAIFLGNGETGSEIGIGAILGAPFMLSTLAFFVVGITTTIYALLGKRKLEINADILVMERDLQYFLIVFILALIASFLPIILRWGVAIILLCAYAWYVRQTFTAQPAQKDILEEVDLDLKPLYLSFNTPTPTLFMVVVQVLISLILIVLGAHLFVKVIEHTATILHVPSLILALVIAPIATELPEKLNSIIWIGQKKDTLALGNITGAMVFQSSIGPAIGIALTPWALNEPALLAAFLSVLSVALVYWLVKKNRKVNPLSLLLGGAFYAVFLVYLVYTL